VHISRSDQTSEELAGPQDCVKTRMQEPDYIGRGNVDEHISVLGFQVFGSA